MSWWNTWLKKGSSLDVINVIFTSREVYNKIGNLHNPLFFCQQFATDFAITRVPAISVDEKNHFAGCPLCQTSCRRPFSMRMNWPCDPPAVSEPACWHWVDIRFPDIVTAFPSCCQFISKRMLQPEKWFFSSTAMAGTRVIAKSVVNCWQTNIESFSVHALIVYFPGSKNNIYDI